MTELDTDQAEQPEGQEDSQAEPHSSQIDQVGQPEQCEDQAEQTGQEDRPTPGQTDSQDDVHCQGKSQQTQPDLHGGRAEQTEQLNTSSSHSTNQKTRQPLTIQRAVARCVPVQLKHNISQLLTPHPIGTSELKTDQVEQPEGQEDSRAT